MQLVNARSKATGFYRSVAFFLQLHKPLALLFILCYEEPKQDFKHSKKESIYEKQECKGGSNHTAVTRTRKGDRLCAKRKDRKTAFLSRFPVLILKIICNPTQ